MGSTRLSVMRRVKNRVLSSSYKVSKNNSMMFDNEIGYLLVINLLNNTPWCNLILSVSFKNLKFKFFDIIFDIFLMLKIRKRSLMNKLVNLMIFHDTNNSNEVFLVQINK